jgi:hypothetical protein
MARVLLSSFGGGKRMRILIADGDRNVREVISLAGFAAIASPTSIFRPTRKSGGLPPVRRP